MHWRDKLRCPKCTRRKSSIAAAANCNCVNWEIVFVDGHKIHLYASKKSWKQSIYSHYYYLGLKLGRGSLKGVEKRKQKKRL